MLPKRTDKLYPYRATRSQIMLAIEPDPTRVEQPAPKTRILPLRKRERAMQAFHSAGAATFRQRHSAVCNLFVPPRSICSFESTKFPPRLKSNTNIFFRIT